MPLPQQWIQFPGCYVLWCPSSSCHPIKVCGQMQHRYCAFIRIHFRFYGNGTGDWSNHSHVMQTIGRSCQTKRSGWSHKERSMPSGTQTVVLCWVFMLSSKGQTLKDAVLMNSSQTVGPRHDCRSISNRAESIRNDCILHFKIISTV